MEALTSLALRKAIRAKYAWPGGYPLFCIADDGEALCMDCARSEYRQIAHSRRHNIRDGWHVSAVDVNWEDSSLTCAHCNQRIESAYAEDNAEACAIDADNFDAFTRAYVEAALWSSTAEDGTPLDDTHGPEDISPDTLARMASDCADFQRAHAEALSQAYAVAGYSAESAGIDFWLTRNRHGAGFWDRGLGTIGEALTAASHAYGGIDLYIGDDEKVHA